jgi:hypothetical protein
MGVILFEASPSVETRRVAVVADGPTLLTDTLEWSRLRYQPHVGTTEEATPERAASDERSST